MIPKEMIEAADKACHGKIPRALLEHILTAALSDIIALASDWRVSDEAIGMRLRNEFGLPPPPVSEE